MKNWVESLKKTNSARNININIINQFYIKLLLCTDFKKSLLIKLFLKRWVYNDSPDLTARNSEAHRTFLGFGKESTQMVAGHAGDLPEQRAIRLSYIGTALTGFLLIKSVITL